MHRILAAFLALCAAAGLMLLAACGSDGDDGSADEIDLTAIAGTPGALPTPSYVDGVVDSTAYGYRARVPDGWEIRPSIVTSALGGGDAFFAPASDSVEGDEVRTNLSVLCDRDPPAQTLDEFVQLKLEILEGLSRENLVVEDHPGVDGHDAKLMTYSQSGEGFALEKAQLLFLGGGCGWNIAVTTRQGELDQYLPVFEEFAESFEVKAES